jgi:hypothetical protein
MYTGSINTKFMLQARPGINYKTPYQNNQHKKGWGLAQVIRVPA